MILSITLIVTLAFPWQGPFNEALLLRIDDFLEFLCQNEDQMSIKINKMTRIDHCVNSYQNGDKQYALVSVWMWEYRE